MKNIQRLLSVAFLYFILLSLTTVFTQCEGDHAQVLAPDEEICNSILPTYISNVKPIIENSCSIKSCHGLGSAKGGISLETYKDVAREVNHGKLLCAINHLPGCARMPRFEDMLTQSEINIIGCWAAAGTPEK